jgi:hypothetical protein
MRSVGAAIKPLPESSDGVGYNRRLSRTTTIALAVGLATIGCRAADSVTAPVGDDSWVTLSPAPWQVRLAKIGAAEGENPRALTVVRAGTETVLATGGRGPGSVVEFSDGGQACRLRVDRAYEYDESSAPVGMKQPKSHDLRTRTYRGIVVTASCPGAAVPGTDAAARGARALWFVPWFVLLLAAGAIAARLVRRDRIGPALGVVGAALAAALGAGLAAIGAPFALTSIAALAGGFVLGWIAGAASEMRPRTALAGGVAAAAGALGVAVVYPRWSMFGPILAVLVAGAAMIVVMVVGVMLPDRRRR